MFLGPKIKVLGSLYAKVWAYNPFKGKFSGSKLQHVVVFNYKKTTFWILLVVKLAFKLISGL